MPTIFNFLKPFLKNGVSFLTSKLTKDTSSIVKLVGVVAVSYGLITPEIADFIFFTLKGYSAFELLIGILGIYVFWYSHGILLAYRELLIKKIKGEIK